MNSYLETLKGVGKVLYKGKCKVQSLRSVGGMKETNCYNNLIKL
jgi:hypothetical protein